jgi:hypothetical protein
VKKAQYQVCLGVVIEGHDKVFQSTAVLRVLCQYTLDVMSLICFWNIHH